MLPAPPTSKLTFPQRLHRAVTQAPSHIMEWSLDDKSFCIHDPVALEQHVLPRYFPSKYSSFKRKLNRWGFRRITNALPFAKDAIVFGHVNFQRHRLDLLACMEGMEEQSKMAVTKTIPPENKGVATSNNKTLPPTAVVTRSASPVSSVVSSTPSSLLQPPAPSLTLQEELIRQELLAEQRRLIARLVGGGGTTSVEAVLLQAALGRRL